MSKGSTPRPIPNRDQYESNYEAIFGKKTFHGKQKNDKETKDEQDTPSSAEL